MIEELNRLMETELVATLRSTPWDHFDFLNGSVNNDPWILVLGSKSSDKKGTCRGVIKLKHYLSLQPDTQGREQAGVHTWRPEQNEHGKKVMVPNVKPVIVEARPALPGEVAEAKRRGKQQFARLNGERRKRATSL